MSKSRGAKSVAVVGCGIFGAMAAIRLAQQGADVTVYERNVEPLKGASYNNQNRLHLGFHYPRDVETALQCIRGFQRFRDEFGDCVLGDFRNAYFISSKESLTSPSDYLAFCDRVGLRYERIDPGKFDPPVSQVDLGVLCDEVVYDSALLGKMVRERMDDSGVTPNFGTTINTIRRDGERYTLSAGNRDLGNFDAVVNCTYADVNRLSSQLGHGTPLYQYEYTMVPILEWDRPAVGITVMDGPFMTILPFGKTGKFLVYHVAHTVVARTVAPHMPFDWLNVSSAPSVQVDQVELFQRIRAACLPFVPALIDARLSGFLEGPRVVLANRDATDARPSIVKRHERGYLSVFTGKIDHCMWVADDIANMLMAND